MQRFTQDIRSIFVIFALENATDATSVKEHLPMTNNQTQKTIYYNEEVNLISRAVAS